MELTEKELDEICIALELCDYELLHPEPDFDAVVVSSIAVSAALPHSE